MLRVQSHPNDIPANSRTIMSCQILHVLHSMGTMLTCLQSKPVSHGKFMPTMMHYKIPWAAPQVTGVKSQVKMRQNSTFKILVINDQWLFSILYPITKTSNLELKVHQVEYIQLHFQQVKLLVALYISSYHGLNIKQNSLPFSTNKPEYNGCILIVNHFLHDEL